MSLPSHSQILIVGAGPTGMVCALTLHRLGLQVTLVDASPNNSNGSRAASIHAHTLEVLDTIDLAKPLIEAGIQASKLAWHGGTDALLEVDLGVIQNETKYPMLLLIAQHDVERILRQTLVEAGVQIFRPHSVSGIKEAPSDEGLDVIFDDGSIIRSQYVVGADGSHSTIRRIANIDFKDPATGIGYDEKARQSSNEQFALADVFLEGAHPAQLSRQTPSFFADKFLLLLPLRSQEESNNKDTSYWRIAISLLPGQQSFPEYMDLDYLQAELDKRFPGETRLPRIASVESYSKYRVKTAAASTFFKKVGGGNIMLVGDAAHVHSPAGGQGLNLGLCDAVCLGRTIHAHLETNSKSGVEKQSDQLLEKYTLTRRKIALRVMGMAKGQHFLMNSGSGWRRILRNMVFWVIGFSPSLKRKFVWGLAGLANRDGDFGM